MSIMPASGCINSLNFLPILSSLVSFEKNFWTKVQRLICQEENYWLEIFASFPSNIGIKSKTLKSL